MNQDRPSSIKDLLDADWAALQSYMGSSKSRRLRHSFSPRFAPVSLVRIAGGLHAANWTRLAKAFSLVNFLLFGIEVPARLKIGRGLVIAHTQGTVLGPVEIGEYVTLYQQVTLGAKAADFKYDPSLRPLVGNHVTISAGAKVLGSVKLGNYCTVGANAVVLNDVPDYGVAVGVPARCIPIEKPFPNE
jgi:serine O-acetyltransferase